MIVRFNLINVLATEDVLKEINMEMEDSKIRGVTTSMRKEIRLTTEMTEIKQEAMKKEEISKIQDNELGINKIEIRMIGITQDHKGKNQDQIKDIMNNKVDKIKEIFNGEVKIKETHEFKDKLNTDGITKKMVNSQNQTNLEANKKVGEGKTKGINNGEVTQVPTKMKEKIEEFLKIAKDPS